MDHVLSRRERKKTDVRTKILTSAVALFGSRGFDAVTIEDISSAADVGRGTIYNYFSAKEDIVVAFLADLEHRLAASVSVDLDAAPERILTDYVLQHFALKAPYLAFVRVFLARMFTDTARLMPYLVKMQEAIDPPLIVLFSDFERRGLLAPGRDIPELVVSFKTVHFGLVARWAMEGPPFRQTIADVPGQVALFVHGLKGQVI